MEVIALDGGEKESIETVSSFLVPDTGSLPYNAY